MTHICVDNLTITGSDNGLWPWRRQVIIWTDAGILLIGPLGTNFSEILIGIQTFSFKKMYFKMSSAKWRSFCLSLNVLTINGIWVTGLPGNMPYFKTIGQQWAQILGFEIREIFYKSFIPNRNIFHNLRWVAPVHLQRTNRGQPCKHQGPFTTLD